MYVWAYPMENSDDPLIVNGLLTLTLTTAMYRQRGSSSKHASITAVLSYTCSLNCTGGST